MAAGEIGSDREGGGGDGGGQEEGRTGRGVEEGFC